MARVPRGLPKLAPYQEPEDEMVVMSLRVPRPLKMALEAEALESSEVTVAPRVLLSLALRASPSLRQRMRQFRRLLRDEKRAIEYLRQPRRL